MIGDRYMTLPATRGKVSHQVNVPLFFVLRLCQDLYLPKGFRDVAHESVQVPAV